MDLDIELMASEESCKDWDDLRFKEIYRKAFIDGAEYAEEEITRQFKHFLEYGRE